MLTKIWLSGLTAVSIAMILLFIYASTHDHYTGQVPATYGSIMLILVLVESVATAVSIQTIEMYKISKALYAHQKALMERGQTQEVCKACLADKFYSNLSTLIYKQCSDGGHSSVTD